MSPAYYAVAQVTGAWGIRGEFKIDILTDNPQRFSPGNRLYVQGAPHEIESRKTVSKRTVLKLRGIDTREQAEALRGKSLEITGDDLPPLAPETFYVHQIIGLEVVSTVGERLGVVADVFKTAGNDVYVVREDTREILVPAIGQVVKEIDLAGGRIVVEVIPGLLGDG